MGLEKSYNDSIATALRLRNLILFFAVTHLVFFVFGEWTVAMEYPYVLDLREEQLREIRELAFIKPLTGPLAGNLPLKILYTLAFNLVVGAFISTTVVGGLVFFLPYIIAVWRGFLVGVLFYGVDSTWSASAIFYGTFIFEFGAYTISSAAGTDVGLSVLFPARKAADTRWQAFTRALADTRRLYFLVVALLVLGAIWEMSLLHYLGPVTESGTTTAG